MHCTRNHLLIYVTTHDYEQRSAMVDFCKSRRHGVLVDFLTNELGHAELIAPAEEPGNFAARPSA
jgi:hypothetical protein